MHNLKYHLLNILAVILFSYTCAVTINQIIKFNISPDNSSGNIKNRKSYVNVQQKTLENYNNIIFKTAFFRVPDVSSDQQLVASAQSVSSVDNLMLMGTITGSWNIARAMIKKKGEKNPEIFGLTKKINNVYGYKLVSVFNSKVYLESNGQKSVLEMFEKKDMKSGATSSKSGSNKISKNISRAEIKQNVMNNIDKAMRGLRAGPYRVNGKIEGYRLITVRPYNILYKLGARSGDIAKRINGHKINSTEKLYNLWQSLKSESRISVDLERSGKIMTFDLNITE